MKSCLRKEPQCSAWPVTEMSRSRSRNGGSDALCSHVTQGCWPRGPQTCIRFVTGVCLSLGCYNKNTIDWVAFKPQNFFFPTVNKADQVASKSGALQGPASWIMDSRIFSMSSGGGRGWELSGVSFVRRLISPVRVPCITSSPSKDTISKYQNAGY